MATKTGGLEGIIACKSGISTIVGDVLTYRGININELAEKASFEEVVYLLWYGDLPNRQQLQELDRQLKTNRALPEPVLGYLRALPPHAGTMDLLRTAVSLLSLHDPDVKDMSPEANTRKAIRLVAQTPTIVAAMHAFRSGREPVAPREDLSLAANFLYMLNGKEPTARAEEIFDVALILHADHELNASTFVARVTASTLSDLHSAIVTAIGTLKGPLHGGANEAVMKMLYEIESPEKVDDYVFDLLSRKEKIPGIGHRVYKQGDPRAYQLKRLAEALGKEAGQPHWFKMEVRIEDIMRERTGLLPNVDFYSATVYTILGIPTDLFTPVFAMSRMSGWTAHLFEQYADNRLIRPRAEYVGPVDRHYVPIEER